MANTLMNHEELDAYLKAAADKFNKAIKDANDRTYTGLFIADQMDWEREEFGDVA